MSKMLEPDVTNNTPLGRRICVVGTSGSGKTHVARELARRLDIPYISNDAIIWRANWQETPAGDRIAGVDNATLGPAWTFDGNLGGSRPEDQVVLSRSDTIVWLDLPRWQVFPQVLARTIWRLCTRQELWHGNRESLRTAFSRDSIVWWSVKTFAGRRRSYGALFANPSYADRARIHLRSRGEVNRWLASID
jgi:adenylate kinase family enzyme